VVPSKLGVVLRLRQSLFIHAEHPFAIHPDPVLRIRRYDRREELSALFNGKGYLPGRLANSNVLTLRVLDLATNHRKRS
jgi:hypothetical protein